MNHMTVKDNEWDKNVTCELDFPSIICDACGYTSERLEDFGIYDINGEEVILCNDCGEASDYDRLRDVEPDDVEVDDYNFEDEED